MLLVDDDTILLGLVSRQLTDRGFDVTSCEDGLAAEALATQQAFDAMVLDHQLPGMLGVELLARVRSHDPAVTIVLLSGSIEIPEVVRAIRAGAEDVQIKPVDIDLLTATIERGLVRTSLTRSRQLLSAQVSDPFGLLDPFQSMQRVVRLAGHAAPLDVPVLLVGEAGTGKHAIASIVHQLSLRAHRPLLSLAFHGRDDEAVIAELRALLAGPLSARATESQGGTLFLDGIDRPGPLLQRWLHTLVDPRVLSPDGAPVPPLRVIASTTRDLRSDVSRGQLLAAFHQRLSMVTIAVPSLRERGADAIALLARRIVERLRLESGEGPTQISVAASQWLGSVPWPGNAPQLRDVLEDAFLRALDAEAIDVVHLEGALAARGLLPGAQDASGATHDWSLRTVERRHIQTVLAMTGDHRTQAARLLGITRTTLYKKIAEYGLDVST